MKSLIFLFLSVSAFADWIPLKKPGVINGSAVLNLQTYEVEGILVRGEDDYVVNEKAGCRRVKVCKQDECRGEDVMKITKVEMD